MKFRHLTIDDGLSQNAVFSMLQDSRDFMWFGTKDGLNRYDGRNFVVFQHNPFDSTAISDAFVMNLFEDKIGRIWTGSLSGEVNVFHRQTETFCKIPLKNESDENVTTNEITDIAEGPDGSIWIATKGDGLIKILVDSDNGCDYDYQQFLHDSDDPKSLNSNRVGNLFFDDHQTFWIGTEEGLNEFDEISETFTRTIFETKHPDAPNISGEFKITSMHISQAGDFWIGNQTGLIKFDRGTKDYNFYPNKYEVFRYGWGSINQIAEDQNGNLWIGTAAGLMQFNPSSEEYIYYDHDPLNPQSISHNLISCILIDKTGILWIGTSGHGINLLDLKANRFKTLVRPPDASSRITGFSIRSILEDDSGDIWISADVLYRWNRTIGVLKSYEISSEYPDEFGNTDALSMINASDGFLWMASPQGLYRHNPISNETRMFKFDAENEAGLRYKEVNAVFEDQDGSIWIANRNYLSKLIDIERGTFLNFRYTTFDSSKDMTRPVIFQDINGILWLGTDNGLVRFNPKNQSFNTYRNDPVKNTSLSNNHIKSILEDPVHPEQFFWIGTSGGLNKFDYKAETFQHYFVRDGLPNDVVYGILPDDDGNLWLSTNKGLSRFNPQTEVFRNFDVYDGLQSNEFNTGAYFKSENGELFFGGIQGMNYFNPKEIKDNPNKPPLVLTGLKIGNTYISNKTHTESLSTSISELSEITFSHKDDVITFEFAALDYSAPAKNQYAYKLDGFNAEWISSGNIASATYTNLPHGRYTFRVKGSNNDGIWNEAGLAIDVKIMPPWWRTLWAYGFYGIFIISILYAARRYELSRFNLKNQLDLEKVESESLRNLDQLRSHFFANISHEFRTPLTLIIGQIETLLDYEEDRNKKRKLASVNSNAEKLLALINQLLDLSKLEAGKMELYPEKQNIVSFLKNQLFSFESFSDTKNIVLNFATSKTSLMVSFDPEKMEKVFINLISNAIKFTESGGRVDVTVDTPKSDIIEIRIKDNGIGISKDRLPHVFDRFYQVDPSNTRKYEGTGIGLALVLELVTLHNGTIEVKSKEGIGSEFIIQLPFNSEDVSSAEDIIRIDQTLGEGNSLVQSFSEFESLISEQDEIILIVEDNLDVRTFIREQLCDEYKILEAANGREGIVVSQGTIPDLIITDLMMPEMGGYEFCENIRTDEKTSHIPIIMLTAKAGLEPKIEGLEVGIDAFLNKPFHVKELLATVKTLIQQRKNLKKQYSSVTYFKPSVISKSSVDQNFLSKAIQVFDRHIVEEQFKVEDYADFLGMSVSQLNRKLNALVGQSAGNFIRSLRLQRSAELLNQTNKTIAEICYEVGFNDQAYFSRAFKKQFGKSPSAFRKLSI